MPFHFTICLYKPNIEYQLVNCCILFVKALQRQVINGLYTLTTFKQEFDVEMSNSALIMKEPNAEEL